MRDTVAIYCGDAGYLFAMLVAARSLRQCASRDNFDILLFGIDLTDDQLAYARAVAATFRAEVTPMSSAEYTVFDVTRYTTLDKFAHVAPSSLARLVTGRHIPQAYKRVLYVDGDTLCVGDFSDLADLDVPAGMLMATPDPSNYWRADDGAFARSEDAYLNALGIGRDATYFNAGFFLADRAAWAAFGEEALTYFAANMDLCKCHDESALNVVARDRIRPLSARWNFMQPMRAWGLDAAIRPRLYHFSGREKPWRGTVRPWAEFSRRYKAFRSEPQLRALAPRYASAKDLAEMNAHYSVWEMKARTIHRTKYERARRALLENERRAVM
ncbi:MAG: glycosyltransferase [Hyphomonadaceae bacterium]|nr:glycosyltransferase [Hyphomonadaceae bacterium]